MVYQQLENAIAVALKLGLIKKSAKKEIHDFLSLAKAIRDYCGPWPLRAHMADFELSRSSIVFSLVVWGGYINIRIDESGDYIRVFEKLRDKSHTDHVFLMDTCICEKKLSMKFTGDNFDKMTVYKSMRKLGSIIRVIEPLKQMIVQDTSEEHKAIRKYLRI